MAAGRRLVWEQELDVHVVVVEFASGADVFSVRVEKAGFGIDPAAGPFVFVAAVKQHDGSLGRLFAQRAAFADNVLQAECFPVGVMTLGHAAVGGHPGGSVAGRRELPCGAELIGRLGKVAAFPAGSLELAAPLIDPALEQ